MRLILRLLDDTSLLDQLIRSGAPGDAWSEFLRRYSNLFLKIIWQQEYDHDEAIEKYLYVCTKFAENGFARLRRFRAEYGERSPKFSTWLAAVTRNLAIDAHRAAHGRRRFPAALLRMSDIDRTVFRLYYWEGYAVDEIVSMGVSTPSNVDESLRRILDLLGDRPVHQTVRVVRFNEEVHTVESVEDENGFSDLAPWLSCLEERERLVVRLRFWEDMATRDIAEALDMKSDQQVYALMHSALKKLRSYATQRNASSVRAIQSKHGRNASH